MAIKKYILSILLILLMCVSAQAATTYNYYFSNAGGGTTCSEGSPCATLPVAQAKVDAAASSDTVNLYFRRGDTWSADTGATTKTTCFGIYVSSSNPIVNIDAYGSGDDPIFDGLVSDFSTASAHNTTDGPLLWNRFFEFRRNNCSISNIEIKRVYGNAVYLYNGNYFTLDSCNIHHFGTGGITTAPQTGGHHITVTNNIFHTGQELWRYSLRSGWEAAIQLTSEQQLCEDNIIRYNVVYDIYGEGIQCPNSLCEYNIVGDTSSIALNTSNHGWDAKTTTVRYNMVVFSDWNNSVYDNMHGGGSSPIGIRVFDEHPGGTNAAADIQIYGNVLINLSTGIYVGANLDIGNPYGAVKIYNNTVIDCHGRNMWVQDGDEYPDIKIYNNAFIRYHTIGEHVTDYQDFLPHAGWTIENNAFWTACESPPCSPTVDTDWQTNYVTGDPKLYGEEKGSPINWDGLAAGDPRGLVDFSDVYPMLTSYLIGAGKVLSAYEKTFLTLGTDFSVLPATQTFATSEQSDLLAYDIGAAIRSLSHTFNVEDGATDVNVDVVLGWTNQGDTTGVDVYFDTGICGSVCGNTKVVTDTLQATYDPSVTTDADYCYRVDPHNSLGETELGRCIDFATAEGPPITSESKPGFTYNIKGVGGKYNVKAGGM